MLRRGLLIALILLVSACTVIAPSKAPEEITLAMGFIPNIQFAPFYVALDKGYFEAEGLKIDFDYGMETDLLSLVGTGELSFAVASGDQVIMARNQGLPVVYVMTYYHRFPVAVVSVDGISRPQDLIGKKVGIPVLYGASYIGWRALLSAAQIDEAKVPLYTVGYTQVASLTQGQVDAAVVYANNEPVQLKELGYEPRLIEVADYMNLVSNGLITNEKTIAERPELAEGLVRAVLQGVRYALEHPSEAFEISKKYVPEMSESQRAVLEATIPLWEAEVLGYSDPDAWEASQTFMREIGLIDKETEVNRMFTNQFISQEP